MLTFDAITKYIPYVDEKYAYESRTAVLDTPIAFQQYEDFAGAASIKIAKIDTDGFVNYSRQNGFTDGGLTLSWETFTLTQDRATSFQIDAMSDDETAGLAVANAMGIFYAQKAVPEVDAYRFAKYYANRGYVVNDEILTKDTVVGAISNGEVALMSNAVPLDQSFLFVSPMVYNAVKNSTAWTRTLVPSENPNRNYGTYDNMVVIVVPEQRFNTEINLLTTPYNGFEPAETAKEINFMIVNPAAIMQVIKHAALRMFNPEINQSADAYKIQYRLVHDAFVMDNKKVGIYAHAKPQIGLTLDKYTATVAEEATTSITATVLPAGSTVVWGTSNSAVATVSSGTVTGVAAGTANITATVTYADGKVLQKTCVVTVTEA